MLEVIDINTITVNVIKMVQCYKSTLYVRSFLELFQPTMN